jgi:hypothetical protein
VNDFYCRDEDKAGLECASKALGATQCQTCRLLERGKNKTSFKATEYEIKKVYYVVYERWISGKATGKGSCEFFSENEIKSMDDVKEIEKGIRQENQWPDEYGVLILYWQFLRDEATPCEK